MTKLVVRMLWCRRATLAIYPSRIAAAVMFLLPNGHAMLDFIDDEPTGIEGFAAVRGTHSHPNRHVAQSQGTDTMDAHGVFHREAPQRFRDDALAFLHCQLLIGFIVESSDFLAFVLIAHPTLETDVAAGTQILQLTPPTFRVDGALGEAKAHQPPATGGMNTTASLAASLRDQSLNSLLTATFNCSRDSVKP